MLATRAAIFGEVQVAATSTTFDSPWGEIATLLLTCPAVIFAAFFPDLRLIFFAVCVAVGPSSSSLTLVLCWAAVSFALRG